MSEPREHVSERDARYLFCVAAVHRLQPPNDTVNFVVLRCLQRGDAVCDIHRRGDRNNFALRACVRLMRDIRL